MVEKTVPSKAESLDKAREIPISGGRAFAIVDETDYQRVSGRSWHLMKAGYAATGGSDSPDTRTTMHRLIMDAPAGMQVDHINGNKLDNRRSNLRLCSNAQNKANCGPHRDTSSGLRGVFWSVQAGKWCAKITPSGKQIHLGYFVDKTDAAKAYDKAAQLHYGEYAWTNEANGLI